MRCERVSPGCPTLAAHPFPLLPSLASRTDVALNLSSAPDAFSDPTAAVEAATAGSGARAKATGVLLPSANVHDAFWYPRPSTTEDWNRRKNNSTEKIHHAFEKSLHVAFEDDSKADDAQQVSLWTPSHNEE